MTEASEAGAKLTSGKYSLKPLACVIDSGRVFFTDFDFNSTSSNTKVTYFIQGTETFNLRPYYAITYTQILINKEIVLKKVNLFHVQLSQLFFAVYLLYFSGHFG